MMVKQSMAGPDYFQWNAGGWFGAQLGSTAWMLLAATWIAPLAPAIAVVGLSCFALPNALGTWLWWRRDRIAPHPALQLLVLSISGSGLMLLLTFDWFWPPAVPRESLWPGYAVFGLGAPLTMARFYALERTAVKERQQVGHAQQAAAADTGPFRSFKA